MVIWKFVILFGEWESFFVGVCVCLCVCVCVCGFKGKLKCCA